jgi:hypothetical protein|tara:strand:+ start:107 stop:1852 length:1746 start_codon:yes stop_codon:yes gene_type:complete
MNIAVKGLVLALFFSLATPTLANERIGDFALLDDQGKFHQLSYYGDYSAVAVLVSGLSSKADQEQLSAFAAVAKAHADEVVFLVLNPNPSTDRGAARTVLDDLQVDLPVLMDESQLVAKNLSAKAYGEVFVLNPQTATLMHRTNTADLTQVLMTMTDGLTQASTQLASTTVTGEEIQYASVGAVSYNDDIVPILERNCVSCHHDGAIAPWSMSSHAMVMGWSPMMKEVVMTKRMPPGQIDPHVGMPIKDVAGLTIEEKQKLIQWIDQGSPRGEGPDLLTALEFDDPEFSLGEPDIVLDVTPQAIPATGVIDYRYVPVELNLDKDVWVSGIEFLPGDRQVLHHVITYLQSPADKTEDDGRNNDGTGLGIGGFAPGRQPDAFQDNSGRLIPAGSNLLLQMHYTTSGRETVDATRIGIFLHDEPPKYVMSGGVAGQRRFMIPPGAKEHRLRGEELIERDAYLYEMMPHMHFRGKYMSYAAQFPDGTSKTLLSVPKYDFNWQFKYELEEPLFLPAGTKLIAQGAMDNSDRNPGNPDPTRPVFFGLQTMHEMFFGFTTIRYVGDVPETQMADRSADDGALGSTGGE